MAIADGLLAIVGIDHPTTRQEIGALAVGECVAHFNAFFRGLAKST